MSKDRLPRHCRRAGVAVASAEILGMSLRLARQILRRVLRSVWLGRWAIAPPLQSDGVLVEGWIGQTSGMR